MSYCKEGFNDVGMLFCESGLFPRRLRFNKNNGRFLATYLFGYYAVGLKFLGKVVTDETSGTPFIEIGKCSPF